MSYICEIMNQDSRDIFIFFCENVEVLENLYGTDRYPEREWYVLTKDVIIMIKSPIVHSSIYLHE